MVLDKGFIEPENIRKLCGKRRFTLAHECAHQILFQLDSDDRKIACHKRPEVRGNGSRVLRTQEDWNEWQANTLGAAILMPQSEVDRAMWFINSRKPLTCYGWRFYDSDQVKIDADVYKRQGVMWEEVGIDPGLPFEEKVKLYHMQMLG